MRRSTLLIPVVVLALILIGFIAWATASLVQRNGSTMLSTKQLENYGLTHWTPLEQWTFAQARLSPGAEVRVTDFRGEGPDWISARFIADMLALTTDLDGGGLRGLNLSGATIEGDIDLRGQELDFLRLVGSTISGTFTLADAVVSAAGRPEGVDENLPFGDVVLWDVTVGGVADFENVSARSIALTGLEGAAFTLLSGVRSQSVMIAESYGFSMVLVLRARIDGDFVMRDIGVATDVVLQGLSATNLVMENMTIGGQFDGIGMAVDGDVVLAGVEVGQDLMLTHSAIGGDLIALDSVRAGRAMTEASVGGRARLAIQGLSQ
ncbi:MAG: hypothetical protein ACPG42_08165 [Alphaproteobacteria bacterium]